VSEMTESLHRLYTRFGEKITEEVFTFVQKKCEYFLKFSPRYQRLMKLLYEKTRYWLIVFEVQLNASESMFCWVIGSLPFNVQVSLSGSTFASLLAR